MQTQTSASASDNGYFALEGKERLEVLELNVCFGRHGVEIMQDRRDEGGMIYGRDMW